jgi:hypothetical protein
MRTRSREQPNKLPRSKADFQNGIAVQSPFSVAIGGPVEEVHDPTDNHADRAMGTHRLRNLGHALAPLALRPN